MSIKQLDIMDYISTQTMIHGDCLEEMRKMADNSIDFVVCDPPYMLNFMGKQFDKFKDNPAANPEYWKEALRICKPGSMLAAFGGDRTHHHLMNALEEAGWTIRTCLYWIFGSGFPKNYNIGNHVEGFEGYGTALKPAVEIIVLAIAPLDGNFKQNAEKWGVAGINIDDSRIGKEGGTCKNTFPKEKSKGIYGNGINGSCEIKKINKGRWPSNLILSEEAAEQLDEMTGILKSGSIIPGHKTKGNSKIGTFKIHSRDNQDFPSSSGGGSRFFYVAKASSKERNAGLRGMPLKEGGSNAKGYVEDVANGIDRNKPVANFHPTVKPIALMKYIIKLLAPPNNPICLDPFAGSGSTLLAAKELGINCIGIEKELEYFEIAQQRIKNHG